MRIVFVCTTNVWGSAMAELMARSILAEWDPDRQLVQVFSAGIRAQVDAPMPASAQQVLSERGFDGSTHRARWMGSSSLAAADLTLTMGEMQRAAALALNPRGLRSTFTLAEAAGLVNAIAVASPLSPEGDRHARAVVAEMAAARRLRSVPAGADDLPDLMLDEVGPVRMLADQLEVGVKTVLRAVLLPEFAARPADLAGMAAQSRAAAVA